MAHPPRFGDRSLDTDIGNLDAPAWLQHSHDLLVGPYLVGHKVDHTVGDNHIGPPVGDGQGLGQPLPELDVGEAGFRRGGAGPLEHRRRPVHADNAALRTHGARRDQTVHAGTGSDVDDILALLRQPPVERVRHTRERGDRGPGQTLDPIFEVAGVGRGASPRMEMETRVWALQDLHVLVLDLLAEPFHVHGHVVGHADVLSIVRSSRMPGPRQARSPRDEGRDADRRPTP